MNIEELKQKVKEVKGKYPNIDENPNLGDGCYELAQFIINQFNEIQEDNKKKILLNDIDLLLEIGYINDSDEAKKNRLDDKKPSCLTIEQKTLIKNKFDEIIEKNKNGYYYNNHNEKGKSIGLFGKGSTSLSNSKQFKFTADFSSNFINACKNILLENHTEEIYNDIYECFKNQPKYQIGAISQILHMIRPDLFPVFNKVGNKIYGLIFTIQFSWNCYKLPIIIIDLYICLSQISCPIYAFIHLDLTIELSSQLYKNLRSRIKIKIFIAQNTSIHDISNVCDILSLNHPSLLLHYRVIKIDR